MDKKQKQTHPEVGEDATQYGEFVSSYFAWVPLPEQKQKAEEMAKITKSKKENCIQIRKKKNSSQINEEENNDI